MPDNAGAVFFSGGSLSNNDLNVGASFNVGNMFPTVGTTSSLEHGGLAGTQNNGFGGGAGVWSTANNLGQNAQYTLDLGGTFDVTEGRAFPRNDGCCSNRWRNLDFQLVEDDGTDQLGNVIANALHTAGQGNIQLAFEFAPAAPVAAIP